MRTSPFHPDPAAPETAGPRLSRDRLAAIVQIQQEIATVGPDLDTVMEVASARVRLLTGADGAVVELVEGEEMVYRAGSGTGAIHVGLRLGMEGSLSGLCARTGDILRCDDSEHDARVDREAAGRVGARSMVVVPLGQNGGTLGVLKVFSAAPGAFTEFDVHALQLIAGLVTAALDSARKFDAIASLLRDRRRVQEALAGSEARFRNAMEFAPIGKGLVGLDGRWVAVNRALCEMLGYPEEELLRLTFQDVTHPDDLDLDLEHMRRLLAGELHVYEMEKRYVHREGHVVRALLSRSLVRDPQGAPVHFISQVQDITGRVRAEERFRLVARATRDPVWDWDVAAGRVEWNEAVESTFGYPPDEVGGDLGWWTGRVHPDDVERVLESLHAAVAGGGDLWTAEYRFRRRGGDYATVLDRGYLLRDAAGAPSRMIGSMVDLTERARMEEVLRRAGAEMARSNEELQQFAYVASHDLQEPLRKIQAFGDRLRGRYADVLGEEGRDYLERMHGAATRMRLLIQDLLAFSRISSTGRVFAEVELERVAREVVSDLQARVEATGGEVVVDALPRVEADPVQVRQLFQNLIGNALKFHRPGVPPRVRVAAKPLRGAPGDPAAEAVEISVADNGIGFEPKYLDRIFAPFQRLHGRNEYEGTGMGLAICRKIADRHDGAITADGVPGEGATFRVTIPRRHPRVEGREAR